MDRMLQDMSRLEHQSQEQAQILQLPSAARLLSSRTALIGDSLHTMRKQSNVKGALHSEAAKSICNHPSAVLLHATNTDPIEQEHWEAPGGIICVPCRARGMPKDHVFKTSHFEIPDSIKHGDDLLCTFPVCRAAGVKFCFCSYCRVPVAKRNFRVRHHHFGEALPLSATGAKSTSVDASPACNTASPCIFFPPTKTNAAARNNLECSTLEGLVRSVSGKGGKSRLGSMVAPSLQHSAFFPTSIAIDSVLESLGVQVLLRQSDSTMSAIPPKQLDIDTLTASLLAGTTNNTSPLSLSSSAPRQLLSQSSNHTKKECSVPLVSGPAPRISSTCTQDMLGSYSLTTDALFQKDNNNPKPRVAFPCRARGMPADHRRTASFFIPTNVKHGDSLTCSYPACRDLGVKFCFCVYCNIPVAKRCFRMRHHHLEEDGGAAESATIAIDSTHQSTAFDNDRSSPPLQYSSSSPSHNTSQAFTKVPSPLSEESPADISDHRTMRSNNISALAAVPTHVIDQPSSKKRGLSSSCDHVIYHHGAKKMPKRRSDSNLDCVASSALVVQQQDHVTKCVDNYLLGIDRRVQWDALLRQRPAAINSSSGQVDLHAWLLSVIHVSDSQKK